MSQHRSIRTSLWGIRSVGRLASRPIGILSRAWSPSSSSRLNEHCVLACKLIRLPTCHRDRCSEILTVSTTTSSSNFSWLFLCTYSRCKRGALWGLVPNHDAFCMHTAARRHQNRCGGEGQGRRGRQAFKGCQQAARQESPVGAHYLWSRRCRIYIQVTHTNAWCAHNVIRVN